MGFIASEIIKIQVNRGRPRELYFFRDEQGLEVDFVVTGSAGKIQLVEAKWSKTVTPGLAAPLVKLARAIRGRSVEALKVHRASGTGGKLETVVPDVRALSVEDYLSRFPVH